LKRKCKCVFLDRDGVINKKAPEGDYIKKWNEFKFLPGVKETVRRLNKAGFLVIIITNQRGIAKGLMTEGDLKDIHAKMIEEFKKDGAKIDGIYYCLHDEKDNCNCRKPKIGLFLEAKKDFNIEMSESCLIGDSESDILAGQKAGCKTILLNEKLYKNNLLIDKGIKCDFIVSNLQEVIYKIVRNKH
jgi:histidinol-phosphate phosphatase family protein